MFVLEIEFAVDVRSETVDGLGALLEWSKKVFLLCLSNPVVIPLMLCRNSGIDPLSSLSFPLVMTRSWFGNSQSTLRTLFLLQDLTHTSDLSHSLDVAIGRFPYRKYFAHTVS